MENSVKTTKFKGDRVIWIVFFFLCLISIIEVFSASSNLSFNSGNYLKPVLKHCGILFIGIIAMLFIMNIKCKYFKVVTPFALFFSFIGLIAVFFLGETTNGSQRWLSFLGIQFQPSELAKGALVLATAQILSAMQTVNGADKHAFKYILIISLFMIGPIAVENLSTAILLAFVVFLMMFIGKVPKAQLGKLMGVVMVAVVLFLTAVLTLGNDKSAETQNETTDKEISINAEPKKESTFEKVFHRFDTWKARIVKFVDKKEVAPEDVDLDKDAQTSHANIAIASSNLVGKGPGNSVARDFLSQAFSDFIYAIIIEEMGILGAAGVCFLYIILLFRTANIANKCVNTFPALLIMGFALLLVVQALFNMAVAVGLVPVTGQPLPLISKGGTSTIVNCAYIGIILSVSYSAKKKDDLTTNNDVKPEP
ncbi:MAG: FtsW/RodA/SpoVE family cell cycle protein [Prevotella sp.]|nr:FtsW/RodA/SpoVE family cell cycle protein [Paraprevotella sp.]MCI6201703.1 FtsW/RodA/SpoVE family cell cycle protein [Paraprevotella sp.]MDD7692597.1 FtsW/RodA/SpoVE family cell cycle protein [Prevotella sp.]